MTTVTVLAPTKSGQYATRGATYTPDTNGFIYNVPVGNDLQDLMADGCLVVQAGANVGTAATGVTALEYGDGFRHTTLLTFGSGAVLPAIAGGAALGVGKLVYTLPAGSQIIESARMAVAITQTAAHITADTPTVGLGHVVASGAVAVLSGTATFQSIAVGKAAADCNGTATVQTALATASPFSLVSEAGGVKSIYFNAAATWAASGDPAAILTGTILLNWQTLA
jgi:hypothetical protein